MDSIGARVVERLDEIRGETFDLAHVHHNITAMEVRECFPHLPMLYLAHGILPYLEQPPAIDLQISRFLAVSEEVRDALIAQGIPAERVGILPNIVDSQWFCPSSRIRETPEKALVLSARIDERREQIIRQACSRLGIHAKFIGGRFGEVPPSQLPLHINEADIVFSLGRGVIEAMMCGRIPIIFDYLGGDGMVTAENLVDVMACNFSGRRRRADFSVDDLVSEIRKYKADNGERLRSISLDLFDAQTVTARLITVYSQFAHSEVPGLPPQDQKLLNAFVATIHETRAYTYSRLMRTATQASHDHEASTSESIPLPATGNGLDSWRESIRHLESLLWVNEQDPAAHYELGLLTYHSGEKLRALGHFQRAAALLPHNPEAKRNLRILYPELVDMLIADLGGRTEHVRNLEANARNLEADLRNAENHSRNLETEQKNVAAHAGNLEVHARNLEGDLKSVRAHVSNLETQIAELTRHASNLEVLAAERATRTSNLETHTANLEGERRRLQDLLNANSSLTPATSIRVDVERMVEMIWRIQRDGIFDIAVYGAGEFCRAFMSLCRLADLGVRCVVDSNETLWGGEVSGVPIVSIDDAMTHGVDVFAIASMSFAREISRDIRRRYEAASKRPRIYSPRHDPQNTFAPDRLKPAASAV
jgi:tetratricopeptide (TPR) repeat protein